MSSAQIDLSKVSDLIEARNRFYLLEKLEPAKTVETEQQGGTIVEAGVVVLSASFQAFVEDLFLECSEKAFGREFSGPLAENYRRTFKFWGNPSPNNIRKLFRRLAIADVFDCFRPINLSQQSDPIDLLDQINSVRNCIAHGKPILHRGKEVRLSLALLEDWRRDIETLANEFRFHALRNCGIGHSS